MLKKVFHIDHVIVVGLVLVVIFLFTTMVNALSFFDPVKRSLDNFSLKDIYYEIIQQAEAEHSSNIITIVDMSTAYRRDHIASIIEDIASCEPAVLGVDIVFEGWREDTLGSELLMDVVRRTENTIFASKLTNGETEKGEEDKLNFAGSVHSFFSEEIPITEGFTNVDSDAEGKTLRMFPMTRRCGNNKVYSFTAQVAEAYQGNIIGQTNEEDRTVIFSGTKIDSIHCDSVRKNCELIKDRIVLLGALNDYADKHYTPIGRIPGVEFQAYAIQTLLEHNDVKTMSNSMMWLVSILVIYLSLVLRVSLYMHLKRSNHPFAAFFTDSSIGFTFLTFLWVCLLVMLNFLVFAAYYMYMEPLVMCMGVALMGDASAFYEACIRYLDRKGIKCSFIKNSVYYIKEQYNQTEK
ncbi:MAG: CHASE2 domain-containing protein [Bacteroidaceae bacterium]|nr:CHASE2 domain-containing protein [Bacteroidaceae bacterium]